MVAEEVVPASVVSIIVTVEVVLVTVVVTVVVLVMVVEVPEVVVAVVVVTVDVLVVVVLVVVVEEVVEVIVVVVCPGGMGLNPSSSTVVVKVVEVVVEVVDTQVLVLSPSPPQLVRNPPKTMMESSAASGSSKVKVIARFARGSGRELPVPRPVCRRQSGQMSQCFHLAFVEPKASLQSTSISGSYSYAGTGN